MVIACLAVLFQWRQAEQVLGGHDAVAHMPVTLFSAQSLAQGYKPFLKNLMGLPARYPPLTFAVGAGLVLQHGYRAVGYTLTTLFFLLITMAALVALGWSIQPGRFVALLPLVSFLAAATTWEVGFSYNLEAGLLAAASVFLLMFLKADQIQTKYGLAAAVLLAIALCLSKTVILALLLPAALVWSLTQSKSRATRRALFLAVFFTAAFWLITRYTKIFPEFWIDYQNPEITEGSLFYVRAWFLDYRSGLLLTALAFLLICRLREKCLRWDDLALALFAFLPLVFFTFVDTKHAWYTLAGYVAIPVWTLYCLAQCDQKKWARWLGTGLTCVYLVVAVAHISLAFSLAREPSLPGKSTAGLRYPAPPTAVERQLVQLLVGDAKQCPQCKFALDVSKSSLSAERLFNQVQLACPSCRLGEQVVITDQVHAYFVLFAKNLPQYTRLYSVGGRWPTSPGPDEEGDIDSAGRLTDGRHWYRQLASIDIQPDLPLARFDHREPQKTYREVVEQIPEPEQTFLVAVQALKAKGNTMSQAGQHRQAAAYFGVVARYHPDDEESRLRLAKNLTLAGKTERATERWRQYFDTSRSFGQRDAARQFLVQRPEVEYQRLASRQLGIEIEANADNPGHLYSLHSLQVLAAQLREDWPAALAAIQQQRRVMTPEQEAGVNIAEAKIRSRLGESDLAIKLLEKNLAMVEKTDQIWTETQLHLADLLTVQGALSEALGRIRLAATGDFSSRFLTTILIRLAGHLVLAQREEEALQALDEFIDDLSSAEAGELYLERGKILRRLGQKEAARSELEQALAQIEDKNLREWLSQTLADW